jgi:dimethylglycine dehydrogenase
MDMCAVDPRRYTDYADADYCEAKALETYGHEYGMHFPHKMWPAGRDKKLSPNHASLQAAGAQFGAYNGWERANWFAHDGEDTSVESTETWEREGPWKAGIAREVEAATNGTAVLDMPGFSRYTLTGEGAAEWLRTQISGALPKAGRMNLGYFADSRGRIVTEVTIIRWGEDDFWLMTAAVAQWHDFEFLQNRLAPGLTMTDITKDWSTMIVSGAQSRDLLSGIAEADWDLGWLTIQDGTIAGKPAKFFRINFGGELGWEVHTPFDQSAPAYEAVRAAGATPFGMFALNSMRIEKGYRTWKGDLSTDYTLLEGGLERFIRFNKDQDFPGKAALLAEKERGVKQCFATMTLDDAGAADAPYMSPIWHNGEVVGQTTSGDYGFRINQAVVLGMLRTDLNLPGTKVEVEVYGNKVMATVHADAPLWDADNARIRA